MKVISYISLKFNLNNNFDETYSTRCVIINQHGLLLQSDRGLRAFGLNDNRVHIHQKFSKTFFVFFSKICKLECNTTSDWLNRMV